MLSSGWVGSGPGWWQREWPCLLTTFLCPTSPLLPPTPAEPISARQPALRPHVHKQPEKTTRVRTVLNEKQLHTLRTCYAANPRPDALMKEQLVEMTGLSPRVIRVWFQNKRCKDKKRSIMMKQLQQQQPNDKTVSSPEAKPGIVIGLACSWTGGLVPSRAQPTRNPNKGEPPASTKTQVYRVHWLLMAESWLV